MTSMSPDERIAGVSTYLIFQRNKRISKDRAESRDKTGLKKVKNLLIARSDLVTPVAKLAGYMAL